MSYIVWNNSFSYTCGIRKNNICFHNPNMKNYMKFFETDENVMTSQVGNEIYFARSNYQKFNVWLKNRVALMHASYIHRKFNSHNIVLRIAWSKKVLFFLLITRVWRIPDIIHASHYKYPIGEGIPEMIINNHISWHGKRYGNKIYIVVLNWRNYSFCFQYVMFRKKLH